MAEVKLTAEQVQRIWEIGGYDKAAFEAELRRMGLIAEEPEPLLEEAETLHGAWIEDDGDTIDLALRALRRGIALGEASGRSLTRPQELAERMVPIVRLWAERGANECWGYTEWVEAKDIIAALTASKGGGDA